MLRHFKNLVKMPKCDQCVPSFSEFLWIKWIRWITLSKCSKCCRTLQKLEHIARCCQHVRDSDGRRYVISNYFCPLYTAQKTCHCPCAAIEKKKKRSRGAKSKRTTPLLLNSAGSCTYWFFSSSRSPSKPQILTKKPVTPIAFFWLLVIYACCVYVLGEIERALHLRSNPEHPFSLQLHKWWCDWRWHEHHTKWFPRNWQRSFLNRGND